MKISLRRYFAICLCFVCLFAGLRAQDETLASAAGDKYVISAKAGGVNFVEGTVNVVRKAGRNGVLLKGDELQIGDRVTTGPDGKAEVLLNPGSFLRLGGNAVFEFQTTTLDDLQLKLDGGSAILEVFATEEFQVVVSTPKTKYVLIQTGVYRIDVPNSQTARLRVWKGNARAGSLVDTVKSGRVATLTQTGGIAISKFDRGERDSLDNWSRMRSKELAKISSMLARAALRTTLMRTFLGRRWNMFGSFGLWVLDPFFGGYCFLPFGYGWNSPYGYGYGQYIGWYDLPPVIYYPPPSGGGSTGNPTPPANTPIVSAGDRSPTPPFERLQQTMGGGRGFDRGSYDSGSGSSSSTYSPPSSSSSSSSSAPTKIDTPSPPPTKQP